jgi:hypothetical protein
VRFERFDRSVPSDGRAKATRPEDGTAGIAFVSAE